MSLNGAGIELGQVQQGVEKIDCRLQRVPHAVQDGLAPPAGDFSLQAADQQADSVERLAQIVRRRSEER